MQKTTVFISDHINKPKLDWVKMKIEAFKRLDENNRIRSDEDFKLMYPRAGEHIFKTVEKLITLFRKKFDQGKLDGFKLKFTYSYFKKHCDSRYTVRTFINHFNTIADSFNSIFSVRMRDTLKLPGRECNCTMIEFAPGIVQYTDARMNAIHDMAAPTGVQYANVSPNAASAPRDSYGINSKVFTTPDERAGGAKKFGDLLGSFFKPSK